jgi:hypothetical protein
MFGTIGLIATAGSFCLFCGNGDGGLPTVTSVSPPCVASAAGTRSTAAATATAANELNDRFISPPFPKNEDRWSLGDQNLAGSGIADNALECPSGLRDYTTSS